MTFLPYETFEHEADIGIRGSGRTLEEAFENTARALYSVMVNVGRIVPKEQRIITVSAPDVELLLVEWLNALLSLSDIERMVFSTFEVTIQDLTLRGIAWGENLDKTRHEPGVEVKGATYHLLSVAAGDNGYTAQCVVDV
ncbi:MAG TPA: archease [Nitrospirota bacterium]|nr:archease [Nitrospirota bacterium]